MRNLSTLFLMLFARSLNPAIVFKDFSSLTLLEVALEVAWELFLSPRSVRSTPTESWIPTLLCLHPRSLILLLSPTMPPSQSTSWLKTLMRPSASTMRHSMTSASAHSSLPHPPMEIWTILFPSPCQVSPLAFASLVSSMLISGSWLSTWFLSLVSTSSCQALLLLPQGEASSTDLLLFLSWPNRCLMPRTWWQLAILATEGKTISLLKLSRFKRYIIWCYNWKIA